MCGPARRSELVQITQAGHTTIAAIISRLRASGHRIMCARSPEGDPRYEWIGAEEL